MKTHRKSSTRIYAIWCHMKSRCLNPKDKAFYRYGGRGINVSKRWLSFDNFYQDMVDTYRDTLTLDRINNNKGYSKKNCRWATYLEQANNTRKNRLFEYKGVADSLTNWAKFFKFNKSTLDMRVYKYGWSIEKALFEPVRRAIN